VLYALTLLLVFVFENTMGAEINSQFGKNLSVKRRLSGICE